MRLFFSKIILVVDCVVLSVVSGVIDVWVLVKVIVLFKLLLIMYDRCFCVLFLEMRWFFFFGEICVC